MNRESQVAPLITERLLDSTAEPVSDSDSVLTRTPLIDAPYGSIPVLAFGSGLTALGALRGLRRCVIPVYSVCPAGELPTRSRWYHRVRDWPNPPAPPDLAHALSSLSIPNAVLVPCSDDWVTAISSLPDDLKRRFPASVP